MSATTSKSLSDDISCIRGIGPKRARAFRAKGINTVKDLLYFFPIKYEDRRQVRRISELAPGQEALVWGRIVGAEEKRLGPGAKKVFKIRLTDGTGNLELLWFNYRRPYLWRLAKEGRGIVAYGRVKRFKNVLQMAHPDMEETDVIKAGALRPIYSAIGGVSQSIIRASISHALKGWLGLVSDPIPGHFIEKVGLPELGNTIRALHIPSPQQDVGRLNEHQSTYHKRIRFDRFLKVILTVLLKRSSRDKLSSQGRYVLPSEFVERFQSSLPFLLTSDQVEAIRDIKQDLERHRPMMRLLQGDVGCGKTVVAAAASYAAVLNGYQVALMAPTQILARQHFVFFSNLPSELGFRCLFVTGALKAEERSRAYEILRRGDCNLIIGTHALIQEAVQFQNLGLVIIDEQHRFGVRQRALLAQKALEPNILVMTATPIPRTLAMILYADLDISVIRVRPEGYRGVVTRIIGESEKRKIHDLVTERMGQGEQVIVICPVIEGSEDDDLRDAVNMYRALKELYEPRFRVALIHGEMAPADKDLIMDDFRKGRIQLLVSTTVVEVGVHAPDATLMVIEHPERFGLSQLHQLRGRVGRGKKEGLCLLVKRRGISEEAEKRLKVLASCEDGFLISEQDLMLRGHGQLTGLKQAGPGEIDTSEVLHNQNLLMAAKEVAEQILKEDPQLSTTKYAKLAKELEQEFGWKRCSLKF